ncbi:MAG: outer membrane lipoprotein carrier protein LolA [Bacteroidales bacterium]|nr:outer membrane lipoprotein carrier protein LolA [Bacteroidales bacterium]MDD3860294.1 outer membrane lipoprotein carrier protein LolA [Bacteroidales bacterium]
MKQNFLIICLLVLSYASFSQNNAAAITLLDEVSAKADNYSSLKIEFTMFVENLHNGKRETYSGSAAYKSGYYKLDIMGQIVYSDGKTNWTYLKDAEEVNITDNADNQNMMMNPQSLLKDYKNNFKVTYIADKFEKNRPLVEIDLVPKVIENKKYSKITVKIDKTKKQIFSARYVGKDGVSYLIEITKFTENPSIPDTEIKYSASLYPGAEIIDMR